MEDIVLLTLGVNVKTGQVMILHNLSPESPSYLTCLAALLGSLRTAGATLEQQVFGLALGNQSIEKHNLSPNGDSPVELPFSES